MDPLHRSDKDSLLATTNRSFPSNLTNALEADQRSLRARRKRSTVSCRQLCVVFAAFVILLTFAGIIFIIYTVASDLYEYIREPHQFGNPLTVLESTGNDSKPELPSEKEMFGEWESIFSKVIYSNMDINSTTKIFHKTVELPISYDVISSTPLLSFHPTRILSFLSLTHPP
ncbi:hypothetical protein [Phaffia rhodozyma]|uniref:Uncharacterized protein n=1 Tax=Phaffia rhodozyma TaxID=264483 RepID=A0A0F7SU55_PHARH|nr:hypothetical protein [Phaffia rhodozyma]